MSQLFMNVKGEMNKHFGQVNENIIRWEIEEEKEANSKHISYRIR